MNESLDKVLKTRLSKAKSQIVPEEAILEYQSMTRKLSMPNKRVNTVIKDIEDEFFSGNEKLRNLPKYSEASCLLFPDDRLKVAWDFIVLLLIIYSLTFFPYKLAFWEEEPESIMIFDLIVDALFFVDVLITFNSAYFNSNDHLITDRKTIITNYLKGWFIIDLIACIPFQLFFSDEGNELASVSRLRRLSRLFRVAKIFRMLKFWKSKSKLLDFINKLSSFFFGAERLLFFLCAFFVFCHLLACLWFGFLQFSDEEPDNWVRNYEMDQTDDEGDLYLASLYFIITTLSTVGFGDIVPVNDTERALCIVIMIVGVFFYSYTIGSITAIMTQSQRNKFKLHEQYAILKSIVKEFSIRKSFHEKIKNALEYRDEKTAASKDALLSILPPKLSIQLHCLINKDLIQNNIFFEDKPKEFIYRIIENLKPLKSKTYEIIYKTGRPSDELYFVMKGRVGFFHEHEIYETVLEYDYFGDIEIFLSEEREFSVEALRTTELLALDRYDLLYALKEFDSVKIEMIILAHKKKKHLLSVRDSLFKEEGGSSYESSKSDYENSGLRVPHASMNEEWALGERSEMEGFNSHDKTY